MNLDPFGPTGAGIAGPASDGRGLALGFYASVGSGQYSQNHFTGLVLDGAGNLNLVQDPNDTGFFGAGSTRGTAIPYGGTFDPMQFYTLSYTVDRSTGRILDISLSGSGADYSPFYSTTLFTPAATVYAGLYSSSSVGGAVYGAFDNFSVTAVPEPSTLAMLLGLAGFGLLGGMRRRSAVHEQVDPWRRGHRAAGFAGICFPCQEDRVIARSANWYRRAAKTAGFSYVGACQGWASSYIVSSVLSSRRVRAAEALAQSHGFFPTGGWGWGWIGDPDRGFNCRQPGGWVFNCLPYLEQTGLYELQSDKGSSAGTSAAATMISSPLTVFACPTRRRAIAYPHWGFQFKYADKVSKVAKTDYGANAGSVHREPGSLGIWTDHCYNGDCGPASVPSDAELQQKARQVAEDSPVNGIVYALSTVAAASVRDGLSNTYLVGEKNVNVDAYAAVLDLGDNENMYIGSNADIVRWGDATNRIYRDQPGYIPYNSFGSAHPSGINMCF